MQVVPANIERDGPFAIKITWTDQTVTQWSARQLRDACPCATCREKKADTNAESQQEENSQLDQGKPSGLPILALAEAQPLRIESMNPVGQYAYNIAFSDGHSSGIYPFELLRQSSDQQSATP